VVDKFDPSKGTAFTYLSQVISTALCTSVSTARRNASRYSELDENSAETLVTRLRDSSGADDLKLRTDGLSLYLIVDHKE
jgi:hypothetical protein